ncbi:MAG: DUF3071 domain-containing protein [Actinobacteria bacterium]|nr:DUF3071 domain-containing protein [Actinomycetota bacterium]
MTDLRFIARSQDGEHLELSDGEGNHFSLRVSDTLRAAINERRLASVVDSAPQFSIKEIQSRLRAGESFAEVARISGLSIEKVERYASPILQERGWIIELAEKASPKGTALRLSELVIQRLAPRGVNMNQISWRTWRLDDGTWHLVLTYPSRDGQSEATWIFDASKRTLHSRDDGARWINGEETFQKANSRSDRLSDHGVLFPMDGESPKPPRLVAVRTNPNLRDEPNDPQEIAPDAKKDGVTKRISIPSWDDIMFGRGRKKDEEEEER